MPTDSSSPEPKIALLRSARSLVHRPNRPWARWALGTGLIFAGWFLVHTIWSCWDGLTDEADNADLAVVFGNTVNPDGTPSPRLTGRLDAAVDLYRSGRVANILVSGGFGKEGHDEALVMRDYLLRADIPSLAVWVDQEGTTTLLTARNSARFLKERNLTSAVAVTQFHHIPRAKLALRRAGIPYVTGAHSRHFELRDLYALAREFAAYYKYLLTA